MRGVVAQIISDAELVARVAGGRAADGAGTPDGFAPASEEALQELLARHGGSVMALARRVLGSREEAEEVMQDTFLRLYRHAPEFRAGRASLRTYLFAIARNLALSRLRARSARPRAAEGIDPHDVAFQAAVGAPDDPLPAILIRDALATLDPDERELLHGAFYEGHSHADLAERNGLPLGTVKSRVRRALLKLRDLLEEGVA